MTEIQEQLVTYLETIRNMRQRMLGDGEFVYAGKEDFLLQHGVWYEPVGIPDQVARGMVKACYRNSLANAEKYGWKHIEGIAISGNALPFPVDHAWNLREDYLIDSTWMNKGLAYLGVEFSPRRARHVYQDDATILDNPFDGFALYRQRWTGEDFARVWPNGAKGRGRAAKGKPAAR